jgi:hypothetical protein
MRDLIKVGCVALVLCLSLAVPVAAGPFEDGVAAYNRGEYATTLRLFRPLADQGEIMYLSVGMASGLKILCSFHNPEGQSHVATCA